LEVFGILEIKKLLFNITVYLKTNTVSFSTSNSIYNLIIIKANLMKNTIVLIICLLLSYTSGSEIAPVTRDN
jgi:hypothetical protein